MRRHQCSLVAPSDPFAFESLEGLHYWPVLRLYSDLETVLSIPGLLSCDTKFGNAWVTKEKKST